MARSVRYGEGRDVLVASATQVVADKGLRGFTFRAVAEHAGVNNSLVAHHFGNRETLLFSALEWSVERSIEATLLIDFSSEERFADAFVRTVATSPEQQIFQYEMILEARRNEHFRAPVEHLYDRYFEATRDSLISLGIVNEVDAAARHVFATLDGLVLQYLAGVSEVSVRAGVHQLWQSIASAIPATE
ncbi:MAG: TetR/AcrR family transcriptional regulator [Salinibacterium amurskyense]